MLNIASSSNVVALTFHNATGGIDVGKVVAAIFWGLVGLALVAGAIGLMEVYAEPRSFLLIK